ncbi:hypothetical protein SRABI26_04075 [Arthrobacter sp. Bi26]|nr:hypothetical protein SRABI26_04075 [Arthrobacter sp. Bi26]
MSIGLGREVLGGGLGVLFVGVEEFEDPLGGGDAGLQHVGHASHLAQRLGELARVLDERRGVAQAHGARGHAQPADDGDPDVAEVGDKLHDRHDHAGDELGTEAGLVEFLVALVEAGQHVGVAAEHADEVVAGEGFLDLAVELAGVLPLGGEELLAAGADDAGGHAGERQGDECDQGQLPGHDEHHDHDPDDGEGRVHELREGLLERLLDVVDVVGHAGEDVAALAGVEVVQRELVQFLLGVIAQGADHAHDKHVEDIPLEPQEDVGDEVHHQHHADEERELLEIDARARHYVHLGQHVGEVVLALGAQSFDELLLGGTGRELLAYYSGEDHVHRLAQDPRGNDVEDDGDRHHGEHSDDAGALGLQQPHEPLSRGPEVLGFLGRHGTEHAAVGFAGRVLLLDEVVVRHIKGGCCGRGGVGCGRVGCGRSGGDFLVGAHATASALSWDSTISW